MHATPLICTLRAGQRLCCICIQLVCEWAHPAAELAVESVPHARER